MSPESIGFRRFTHASDVWAFGVTMCKSSSSGGVFLLLKFFISIFFLYKYYTGEVFSYAHSPYGELRGPDVLVLLEKGERLECPSPCFSMPIVYEWMLKCWEYDSNNRPSFSESIQFLSTQLQQPKISVQEIRNIGEMLL